MDKYFVYAHKKRDCRSRFVLYIIRNIFIQLSLNDNAELCFIKRCSLITRKCKYYESDTLQVKNMVCQLH